MNISGEKFNRVGESFFFDSPAELPLESHVAINVKNNDAQLLGKITSCEKLNSGSFRIGVKLITPELKERPSQKESTSPPASQPSDTV